MKKNIKNKTSPEQKEQHISRKLKKIRQQNTIVLESEQQIKDYTKNNKKVICEKTIF